MKLAEEFNNMLRIKKLTGFEIGLVITNCNIWFLQIILKLLQYLWGLNQCKDIVKRQKIQLKV